MTENEPNHDGNGKPRQRTRSGVGHPGEHLSVGGFRAALKGELPAARRIEWVDHLAGLCSECLEVLERCASMAKVWVDGGGQQGQSDLVLLALLRLATTNRDEQIAERDEGSPWLRLALREARRVPLGFCRLIVEESRFQGRRWLVEASEPAGHRGLAEPAEMARQAMSIVSRSSLAVHDPNLHRELIIRAQAYLGEAFRLTGRSLEAERALAEAEQQVPPGGVDPELEATLLALGAYLARDRKDPVLATELLQKAEGLLRESPGLETNLASVLISKGTQLGVQGCSASARTNYRDAEALLAVDPCPRQRLSVEHNLAVEDVKNGELDAAYQRFMAAAPLYEQYGEALIRAQRNWVVGNIHRSNGNWNEAENMLRAAVHGYCELGYGNEALCIVFDLERVAAAEGREGALAGILAGSDRLTQEPERRDLLLDELRRFYQEAPDSKVAALVRSKIAELEGWVDTLPN